MHVMAAGVNFNNVWAARGVPIDVTTDPGPVGRADRLPHRGIGRRRRRVRRRRRRRGPRRRRPRGRARRPVGPGRPLGPRGRGPRLARASASGATTRAGGRWPSSRRCRPTSASRRPSTSRGRRRRRHAHGRHGVPHAARLAAEHGEARGRGARVGRRRGLGSLAIQLVTLAGGRAVAVVSSEAKGEYCERLGAVGYVDRTAFSALGGPAGVGLAGLERLVRRREGVRKAIWDAVGEKASPRIVFEHPGQDTIPTSNFVCDRGGMIVICAGTSGYDTMIDVRYLWYLQKRYQGRTCSTTSRPRPSTTSSANAGSRRRSARRIATRRPAWRTS